VLRTSLTPLGSQDLASAGGPVDVIALLLSVPPPAFVFCFVREGTRIVGVGGELGIPLSFLFINS